MNALRLLLLLSLPGRAAPAPAALRLCDQAIAEAETLARNMEACVQFLSDEHAKTAALAAAKPSAESRGLRDTRTDSIPSDVSSPAAMEKLRLAVTDAVRPRLLSYFSYSSFAAGDAEPCRKMAVIGLETPCRHDFGDLAVARAAQGEPWELVRACRNPQNSTTTRCCVLAAKLKDRRDPCATMVPGCYRDEGTCRAFWDGTVGGDAKACLGLTVAVTEDCEADGCRARRAERVARCEEEAAFARAFKAKDPSLCADSLRCRALMGEPKAAAAEIDAKHLQNPAGAWFLKNGWKPPPVPVERPPDPPVPPRLFSADYKGFVCADPIQSAANRKAAGDLIAAAKACLAGAEDAPGSAAVVEGVEERDEKLARLSLRIETTFTARPKLSTPDR